MPLLPFSRNSNTQLLASLVSGMVLAIGSAAAAAAPKAGPDREISGAVWVWTHLQDLRTVCPGRADESWRFERLNRAALSKFHFSAADYLAQLKAQPNWDEEQTRQVRAIVKGAGGCDTAAIQEWIAQARRVVDVAAQAVGDEMPHWPAPALSTPIRIEIDRLEAVHELDPGTLRAAIHNPGPGSVGIALSGRDLNAGLCASVTSPDMPVTVATDVPGRLLVIQAGETRNVALTLDRECLAASPGHFWGVIILVRNEVVEYRSITLFDIPRVEPHRFN